jgi:hypothetical protein
MPVSPNAAHLRGCLFCGLKQRLRRRVEPATAIAGTLRTGPHDRGNFFAKTKMGWTERVVNKHAKKDGKPS